MSSKFIKTPIFRTKPRFIEKKYRPPALVDVYRRNNPNPPPKPAVPTVANRPFGIQQSVYLQVLNDNAVDGKPFIFPLQKLVFTYCDMGGSSNGQREFIKGRLVEFARKNPQFEIIVQPRPFHHPHIRAYYDNGFTKEQCVRSFSPVEIMEYLEEFKESAGIAPIKPKFPVLTRNESPRGIWNPFKDPKVRPTHKPQAPTHLYSNDF